MREIKFRAWNKEKKIMVYDDEDNSSDYWDGVNVSMIGIVNNQLTDKSYEWMQSTGLKDKKGIEIYEGDIVKSECPACDGMTMVNVLKYCDMDMRWFAGNWPINSAWRFFEVIGNIYENPELLEAN